MCNNNTLFSQLYILIFHNNYRFRVPIFHTNHRSKGMNPKVSEKYVIPCSKCQYFNHCAIQTAISLTRSITIKPRLHFWHLEMKAMFCLYLPLETRPDIIGDLSSLTGVLGSTQWSLTTLCSPTHTGLHFQAQLISSLSGCSRAFSALVGLHFWNRAALKTGYNTWLKGSKTSYYSFVEFNSGSLSGIAARY